MNEKRVVRKEEFNELVKNHDKWLKTNRKKGLRIILDNCEFNFAILYRFFSPVCYFHKLHIQ